MNIALIFEAIAVVAAISLRWPEVREKTIKRTVPPDKTDYLTLYSDMSGFGKPWVMFADLPEAYLSREAMKPRRSRNYSIYQDEIIIGERRGGKLGYSLSADVLVWSPPQEAAR